MKDPLGTHSDSDDELPRRAEDPPPLPSTLTGALLILGFCLAMGFIAEFCSRHGG